MSQHDYTIDNQSFPAFRTDLNNVLGAINSTNSGSSRPSSAVAGTIWLDTSGAATAQLLKMYDGAADILLGTVNFTANTIDWSDSAITLGANSVDSDNYVDGSIDTIHIADDQITLAKMASGTDGNLISYDASGNPVAVATGSDGQVLTSTGAGSPPVFEDASGGTNTPSFGAYMSSSQSASNETFTKIAFDTEDWDIGSGFDTSNKRFVVPSGEAGKYVFGAKTGVDGIDDQEGLSIALYKNGSRDDKTYMADFSPYVNRLLYVEIVYVFNLSVGDYIEAFGSQASGETQNLDSRYSYFYGYKIIE